MNILRFLREQAKGYDCNVCGQNHSRSDIRVLGKLEAAWIVRVTCAKCQTSFKLLVVVDDEHAGVSPVKESGHGTPPTRPASPVVSADEVLDAHEFFQNWDGSMSSILEAGARPTAGATPPDGSSEPEA